MTLGVAGGLCLVVWGVWWILRRLEEILINASDPRSLEPAWRDRVTARYDRNMREGLRPWR